MNKGIVLSEIRERLLLKEFQSQREDFSIAKISNPLSKKKWDAYIMSASCSPWLTEIKWRKNTIDEYFRYGALIEIPKYDFLYTSCTQSRGIRKNVQPIYINFHPSSVEGSNIGKVAIFNLFDVPKNELKVFVQKRSSTTESDFEDGETIKYSYNLPYKYSTIYDIDYPEINYNSQAEIIFKYLY
jgi:hypothetical protein